MLEMIVNNPPPANAGAPFTQGGLSFLCAARVSPVQEGVSSYVSARFFPVQGGVSSYVSAWVSPAQKKLAFYVLRDSFLCWGEPFYLIPSFIVNFLKFCLRWKKPPKLRRFFPYFYPDIFFMAQYFCFVACPPRK